jgi:DNA polymerase I-like protein with 3'-5' exonuclease and polymerase domains/uracil-DNA glycosylase
MSDVVQNARVEVDPVEDNPFGKPDECRRCTLFKEPGMVKGHGNRNASIFYLGEGPGAEEVDTPIWFNEDRHGFARANMQVVLRVRGDGEPVTSTVGFRPERMAPFVGGSGRIRNALLAHAGLHKDVHLFTSNCVRCRPPGNRKPTQYEIACCAHFLLEELEDVDPNVIIAAGDTALETLTGKKKIGIYRGVPTSGPRRQHSDGGSGQRSEGEGSKGNTPPVASGAGLVEDRYKVFPTWHPAFIMRSQHNWAFAVHDLARAKVESSYPEIRRIPFVVDRQASLGGTRETLLSAARRRGAITFDFETTGLEPDSSGIEMCGFVGEPEKAFVYDWTLGAQQLFDEVFADPDIEICGQNILYFDIPYAEAKGRKVRWDERIFDTMVVMHLCNSSYGQVSVSSQNSGSYAGARGTEKDLAFIASNYTDLEYWKSKENYRNDKRGVCGFDVIATDRSAYGPQGLKQELISYGMYDLYYKHVLPVHRPLRKMTTRGVRIHEDRAARWSIVLEREARRQEQVLKEGLGDPFLNLNSPQQLKALLYDKLGLPVQYKIDKKRGRVPTTDKDAIERLSQIAPENAILMSIVNIRHMDKMNSTYVRRGLELGRLHPKFGVSKAANGRFNGWDPNAQNVPEQMRDMWIPDSDEYVLLSADSSQIEWRNSMVLSGDPVGLELLASGADIHKASYAEAFGVPIASVTKAQRDLTKFIVYGLAYGRGAASIAAGNNLPFTDVETFIRNFFARFKVFGEWRERLPELVKKQQYLANPFMRRRWWYTREITEIYNFPPSSTAADMMYEEVIQLDQQLPKGADLVLTVHDEVVVHCHKDVVKEAALCIKTVMQQPWDLIVNFSDHPENVRKHYPNGWFCPADLHAGTDWAMCKSKNPEKIKQRDELEKYLGIAA